MTHRKLCGYDLNGWSDRVARNWDIQPDGEVKVGDTHLGGAILRPSVVRLGDGRGERWIGGAQAALAPHGLGTGWGNVGQPDRRRSVSSVLRDDLAPVAQLAAALSGLAQGAREAARAYAAERRQFGRPIEGFQSIRWKLVDHASRVEAARLLTYRAAWLKDQGRRMTLESSMAKLYASESAVRVSEDAVQIFGGYGFVKDYPAEKFFRDVKLTTIGEGTSEVQRLVIARHLLAA